ncbi:MAG: DUF2723 domain-containing protein [Elusimicrobia bacterium]|nr:DUF2723 domain-containing protein [Candidatus Liberimonas magnetica]
MLIFLFSFILYLFTLFPGVAPYRDTGEMTSVAFTLGIAHPPGYPFYALLSKLFLIILPWGNVGYKLNVLSALAGALTVFMIYKILLHFKMNGFLASVLSFLFATSYLQWYLSLVSEMYTLNTFFGAVVLYIICKAYPSVDIPEKNKGFGKQVFLLAFVFGLGLGNRMDLVLLAAGLSWIFYVKRKQLSLSTLFTLTILFCIGFSVFLFLPVRSQAGALLDWNHPADLSRFWGSLTRKTHGGTLDLLSTNYASGANFKSTILFYLNHVYDGFAYLGIFIAVLGAYSLWKKDRNLAFSFLAAWSISGPLFIYMANMPPNPHALAILEAHFLLPNLIVILWIAFGLYFLYETSKDKYRKNTVLGLSLILLFVNVYGHFPQLDKRNNFVAYDYSKNVFRSSPRNAIVVAKKDVQLFALWNKQLVESQRPDLSIVSQGLSGSFWYIEAWKKIHPDIFIGPLRSQEEWRYFLENNKNEVYFTGDAEYTRVDKYIEEPQGLVNRVAMSYSAIKGDVLLNYIYPYRGKYLYTAYREFFTPDLIDDYSKGYLFLGMYYMGLKDYDKARANFKKALMLKPLFPLALNYISFTYVDQGQFAAACEKYTEDVKQYNELIGLANEYNSLNDVKTSLYKELSEVYLSLGVCYEKTGKDDESLKAYQNAIEVYPAQARACYNKSVIYWKRGDWQKVISELEKALRIDPNYREAAYYLQLAQKNMNSTKK